MLKKSITYTDFNGVETTEDFYFNLSLAELTDMEAGTRGGLGENLQRIMNTRDNRKILDTFKDIIKKSYGVRSDDGRSFLKNEESWAYFEGSGAYEALYLSFFEDPSVASEFVNKIVPADLAAKAAEAEARNGFRPGASTERPTPPVAGEAREAPLTRREAREQETTVAPGAGPNSGDPSDTSTTQQ